MELTACGSFPRRRARPSKDDPGERAVYLVCLLKLHEAQIQWNMLRPIELLQPPGRTANAMLTVDLPGQKPHTALSAVASHLSRHKTPCDDLELCLACILASSSESCHVCQALLLVRNPDHCPRSTKNVAPCSPSIRNVRTI